MGKWMAVLAGACLCTSRVLSAAETEAGQRNVEFHIDAQPLDGALESFEKQAGVGYSIDMGRDWQEIRTPAINGLFSVRAFLDTLLRDTGLTYTFTGAEHVRIHAIDESAAAEARASLANIRFNEVHLEDAPEILVQARHALNADLRRTQDATQPYVVIEHHEIERSQAQSIETLINRQVTSNTPDNSGQTGGALAGRSLFDLRGLGVNQTLVLIDGRRSAAMFIGGAPTQADLNSIPLAAVERIEILPTTASAIYGGGATGGVINVVLRHDCETRLVAGYGDTFSADSANRRAYFTHCFSFGEDRTHLRMAGSLSRESVLATEDRDLVQRGRDTILAHNRPFFMNSGAPPLGAQTNYRTASGDGLNGPGSSNFGSVPQGYTSAAGITPLLSATGSYNMNLANTAQADGGGHFILRNGPETHYLNATLDHQFAPKISGYIDATGSNNLVQRVESIAEYAQLSGVIVPASAPNNPFKQELIATVPAVGGDRVLESRLTATGLTAGFRLERIGIEYTSWKWKLQRQQAFATSAQDAVADGSLDVFHDLNAQPLDLDPFTYESNFAALDSRTDVFTLRLGCTRFAAPAGMGMLLGSLEYRNERFDGGSETLTGNATPSFPASRYSRQGRRIRSGYAEARIPLWASENAQLEEANLTQVRGGSACDPQGASNGGPGAAAVWASELAFERTAPRVELQLAARIDRYTVNSAQPLANASPDGAPARVAASFDSANPTIGLQFWPSRGFSIRASYGTGFLPPSGDQFAPAAPMQFLPAAFRDYRRGGEPTGLVRFIAGGNPDLHPERSESWSAGVVWKPTILPGLRASLDYVRIAKKDNIVSPADLFFEDPAWFETLYPERVTRAPQTFASDTFSVGPITAIDATNMNIASALIAAWDLDIQYARDTRLGYITFWTRGTRQPKLKIRTTPASPEQNLAGVSGNVQKFGGVAGVTFKRGEWEIGWTTRYFDAYAVEPNPITITNQGDGGRVASQTYHDATVSYHFSEHGDAMSIIVLLSAQNIFNQRPPFDAGSEGFASALGDPRLGTYGITISAAF